MKDWSLALHVQIIRTSSTTPHRAFAAPRAIGSTPPSKRKAPTLRADCRPTLRVLKAKNRSRTDYGRHAIQNVAMGARLPPCTAIPVIDNGALSGNDRAALVELARKIGEACKTVGFFYGDPELYRLEVSTLQLATP